MNEYFDEANSFEKTVKDVVVVDGIKAYLKSISNIKRLTFDQEKELSSRAARGDKEAINKLVESNLLLVVSIAKKYHGLGIPMLDLIQEGNLGLMKAAEKYNGEMGYKFSTYATYWIRQTISRALSNKSRSIRIPVHLIEVLNSVKTATEVLSKEHGVQPSVKELSTYLNIDEDKIATVMNLTQVSTSLDTPMDDEGETTIGELVADVKNGDPIFNLIKEANTNIINSVFATLPSREAEILKMRFGIGYPRAMTLEEIGSHYDLTKERIRQLETRAMRKMRNPIRVKMLKEVVEG